MYGKILVPVDGSETSILGLNEAIKIAKAQGSQLRLVHIVNELILDYTYSPGAYATNLIESLRKAGRAVLDVAETVAQGTKQQRIGDHGMLALRQRRQSRLHADLVEALLERRGVHQLRAHVGGDGFP